MRLPLLCCFFALALPPLAGAVAPPPAGTLVIVGGGKMPDAVRRRFVDLAGGKSARIVVVPTASAAADDRDADRVFLAPWRTSGASVSLLHTRSKLEANREDFVEPLRRASAVWISGGDQSRIVAAYGGTLVEREIRRVFKQGGVVGGTSAGAAVLGRVMITGGKREAGLGKGLGLAETLLIDQHFLKRDRIDRLRGALLKHPELIGLGIDESTAAIVRKRSVEVVGESYVLLFLGAMEKGSIRALRSGDVTTLP